MADYIPPALDWVREQVELYESSGGTQVFDMRVREVSDEQERTTLWAASVAAYPPYDEYQAKTSRKIPVFIAEPR